MNHISFIRRHPLIFILSIIVISILFLCNIYPRVYIVGPGRNGSDIARLLLEENRNPKDCYKMIHFDFFGRPPIEEDRMLCVYQYASFSKNPSACELLMPRDYAWQCLGAARVTTDTCSIDYQRGVSWKIGEGPTEWNSATFDECTNGTEQSEDGKNCCYILQLTSEPEINDCSRFEGNQPFMNTCLSQLALKTGNQELCKGVTDENKRVICELQAKYK